MITRALICAPVAAALWFSASGPPAPRTVSGTFEPAGPPRETPVRVEAGQGCVVDLRQSYLVRGTLAGIFEIDYRIIVDGPCGAPMGSYDEEWIAFGSFVGTLEGVPASAKFTYTGEVCAGGALEGSMVLGQGFAGELEVIGNFGEEELSYEGTLD